jgi:hypothetical protein
MSRTTDWVLELEHEGKIVHNGTQYVIASEQVHSEDIFERFERAEFELDVAQKHWSTLRDEINYGYEIN